MSKRRFPTAVGLVAGLGLLVVVVGFGLAPRPGVNQANFDRLQAGWTEDQVRAVLGDAAHDLRPVADGEQVKAWFGEDQAITVSFRDGRVADKHLGPTFGSFRFHRANESVWDRLRRRVGL